MLVKLLVRLSALSLGLSYVACTTPQQQSQLATLHERMNQMISALYSSPLLSKVQAAATSAEELPSSSQESTYSYPTAPAPQIVFMSAPPGYLEAGAQPTDYGYAKTSHPVPRSAWPYPYEYSSYQPQHAPPVYPRAPYPEYGRPAYPQIPPPQSAPLPPALPFPSPLLYPSPYPNAIPFPIPVCQPAFPIAPSLPPPCSPQIPYPPSAYPAQGLYPPSLPYPPPVPTPYSSPIPQQYAPSVPYPSYPVAYSPSVPYPQPTYQPPPAYPKPSDILPQPQYEYSS